MSLIDLPQIHTLHTARCSLHLARKIGPAASAGGNPTCTKAESTRVSGSACRPLRLQHSSKWQNKVTDNQQRHPDRHLCRARRKRGDSDEEDVDEDVDGASSDVDEVEEEDADELIVEDAADDDEEEEEEDDDDDEDDEDTADAGVSDPTTRLFQMVKDRDYDDEEEEIVDDEDDGLMPLSEEPDEMKRRGRKRKAIYERANEDVDLPKLESDNAVDDAADLPDDDFVDPEPDLDSLDDIMGESFAEDEEDLPIDISQEEAMPSRAQQSRPEDSVMDANVEELEAREDAERAERVNIEDDDDDGLGPLPQYNEVPERSYTLGNLLEMCGYNAPEGSGRDQEVCGIQDDHDQVLEGDLYICREADNYDGYNYIADAVENGAAGIVSQYQVDGLGDIPLVIVPDTEEALRRLSVAFHEYPSRRMLMVGITGSKGKTTTSWLVRGIFEEMQLVTGMVGSLEYSIAVDKLTVNGDMWKAEKKDITLDRDCSTAFFLTPYGGKYEPPPSTPDVLRSQMVLAAMADRGATACVYEAGLEACQQGWTKGVDMDVAIYMGLDLQDVQALGGAKAVLQGLWPMFSSLKDPERQTAVVNLDDPYCEEIMEFAKAVPSVTFSVSNTSADVYVDKVYYSLWETEVVIATPAGKLNLSSTLVGPLNLPNILAAIAAGLALTVDGEGIPLKAIVQGIEATEIVPGRCEVIDEDQEFGVVVDSANDPKSLSRLLDSIRAIQPRRILLVTGCEGEREKELRPFLGEVAHYKADLVILTSNNPRGETPANIIADIIAGYPDELLKYNARQVYTTGFLHDPARIPLEALEFSWQNCFEFRRYVMEDRWTAIRWAIGTAQKNDIVVIAGKGAEDFQEWDIGFGLVKSWFDDRVECRNALSRVKPLAEHDKDLNRKELPWMEPDERLDNPRLFGLNTDNLATLEPKYVPKEWLEKAQKELEEQWKEQNQIQTDEEPSASL